MKFIAAALVAVLSARGAGALDPLPDNNTVPECRVPFTPKILELSDTPTGAPINYGPPPGTPAPATPQEVCISGIVQDKKFGTIGYVDEPIVIVSKNGDTVDFKVKQVWKTTVGTTVSWVATEFVDAVKDTSVCAKKDMVAPGVVDYSTGNVVPSGTFGATLSAQCYGGIAKVNLYVHDGSPEFQAQPTTGLTIPPMCNPSADVGGKVAFYFSVSCQQCPGAIPTTPTTAPTGSPVKTPTGAPVKPPTKAPTKAPVKPPTKAPTGAPVKGPTKSPTKAPVKPPTKAPTGAPVKNPTKSPTKAPVKPPTKAPTGAPVKPPTKSPTKAPVKPPTKAPTGAPVKPPTKGPTKAPVKPPTKAPTGAPVKPPTKAPTRSPVAPVNMCVSGTVSMAQQWGTINYPEMPISIVPGSQTGNNVTISVKQVWKSTSISWISTRFTDPAFNAIVCPKKNEVNPGLVDYSSGSGGGYELKNYVKTYGTAFTAKCTNNVATVEVYVHDGMYDAQQNAVVPDECSPSSDIGQKIGYKFTVPCNVCVSGSTPVKSPTKTPTKAPVKPPTKNPTGAPVKSPTKAPTKAPVKPPTKAPTGAPVKPPTKSPTKAPVKPPTKAPTGAPVKPPTKSPTKAPVKPPTKAPTKAPVKPPTKAPTKSPTKAPTVPKVCPATLVNQWGTIAYPSLPIKVVPGSYKGTTVQFQVEQVWKNDAGGISWVSTRFVNPGDSKVVCPKKNEVPDGLVNYASGSPGGAFEVAGSCSTTTWGYVLTAKCVNNKASVQVYVHDGQYDGQPDLAVPDECSPSNDDSRKIGYNFTIPCTCV